MTFRDYFSAQASAYATYRPRYPAAIAELLAERSPGRSLAWDAGCGSGQLSTTLADHFERVIATDPSPQQLERAPVRRNIEYRVATAEDSGLPDACADLSVAAQAAHWFDWPRFVEEVGRVTRPGGLVALIAYEWMVVDGKPEPAVERYKAVVEPYWPEQRHHIADSYRDLVLPWPEEPAPAMELEMTWTREELAGYISSWSSTNAYRRARGDDMFAKLCAELEATWPEGERRRVTWPMLIKLARKL